MEKNKQSKTYIYTHIYIVEHQPTEKSIKKRQRRKTTNIYIYKYKGKTRAQRINK